MDYIVSFQIDLTRVTVYNLGQIHELGSTHTDIYLLNLF